MIITCQECNTRFNLDENLLKETGSKVRCSICKNIFVAFPPTPLAEPEKPIEVIPDYEAEQEAQDIGISKEDKRDLEEPEAEVTAEIEEISEPETEELELDLGLELEEEPEAEVTAGAEDVIEEEVGELKLDLEEEEVEADETPMVVQEAEPETEELELDLELEEEPEVAESELETEEELDLSDIEDMLDAVEEQVEEEPEDIELDLNINEEPVEELAAEDADLEFEIEDIEQQDLSEEEAAPEQVADIEKTIDLEQTIDTGTLRRQLETEEAEEPLETDVITKPKPARKKRISTPVLALLIAVILVIGAVGGTVTLNRTGTDIPFATDFLRGLPFVSNLLRPAVQDVGNLKINFVQNMIDNRFVENSKAGTLLVVTGKVKNNYSDPRSFIRITCNLYTKGRNLVQKETVFCGNILSDLELASMDVATIKKRLNNRIGDNHSNVKVKPGKTVPFMVVFSHLPDDLEEYDFVVEGSSPG